MNSFFGIVKISQSNNHKDAHSAALKAIESKFPRFYNSAQSFVGDNFHLLGGFKHSNIENHSQLFVCGEIYNLKEILNHLHGSNENYTQEKLIHELLIEKGLSAIALLNGRFTLIYKEEGKEEVHLFNDHMGVQQLYYHQSREFILFASEIKYLLSHSLCTNEIDWENALKRPIPFIVLDGNRNYNAWFKDIYLLPEASDLLIRTNAPFSTTCTSYWSPYSNANYSNIEAASSADTVMDEYMNLLDDAVNIRIQDGNVANAFLSGGLDSSIICAIANKYKPINTFSILTQTTMLEETSAHCNQLAKDLNFSNTQFVIPSHKVAHQTDIWKKRIYRDESPYVHKDAITKTLLQHQISKHFGDAKYVLTGTGSDQFNGGLTRWISEEGDTPEENWEKLINRIKEEELKNSISDKFPTLWGAKGFLTRNFINEISSVKLEDNPWMYYVKSNLYINQYALLWDENRAGYSNNRSVRYPFMDFRFYELIAKIPTSLQAQLFYDKNILRQPAAKLLPNYITNKGKAPAFHPLYDQRSSNYIQLTKGGNYSLLEEALGNLDEVHPFVAKDSLITAIQRLEHEPNNIEWQYLMHLVNLGILSKLSEQTESSTDYETDLDAEIEMISDWNTVSQKSLRNKLDIYSTEELNAQPLCFGPSCRMVKDDDNEQQFLVKNDELIYEIDLEDKEWTAFLEAIDGHKSLNDILSQEKITFPQIQEYYELCLKEEIITPILVNNEQ